jgi:hypothetical protein
MRTTLPPTAINEHPYPQLVVVGLVQPASTHPDKTVGMAGGERVPHEEIALASDAMLQAVSLLPPPQSQIVATGGWYTQAWAEAVQAQGAPLAVSTVWPRLALRGVVATRLEAVGQLLAGAPSDEASSHLLDTPLWELLVQRYTEACAASQKLEHAVSREEFLSEGGRALVASDAAVRLAASLAAAVEHASKGCGVWEAVSREKPTDMAALGSAIVEELVDWFTSPLTAALTCALAGMSALVGRMLLSMLTRELNLREMRGRKGI